MIGRPQRGRRTLLAIGLVAILSGFGWLIYGGIGENLVYFLTPTELHAKGETAYDAPVRLGGVVKPGSVSWNAEQLDLRFALTDGGRDMAVHSRGAPPQMFRDSIGVIVEGRLTRAGVFESTSLMVKHSNEYRAPDHGEKPVMIDESLMRGGAR
ncbi:MAG TPA: cytochrome c maturation protein CcmE [Gemmatimonadaceae bacterium]|nr:cytochrome c maturation protein CcmE [Gemmatimonadaceae bacterium]